MGLFDGLRFDQYYGFGGAAVPMIDLMKSMPESMMRQPSGSSDTTKKERNPYEGLEGHSLQAEHSSQEAERMIMQGKMISRNALEQISLGNNDPKFQEAYNMGQQMMLQGYDMTNQVEATRSSMKNIMDQHNKWEAERSQSYQDIAFTQDGRLYGLTEMNPEGKTAEEVLNYSYNRRNKAVIDDFRNNVSFNKNQYGYIYPDYNNSILPEIPINGTDYKKKEVDAFNSISTKYNEEFGPFYQNGFNRIYSGNTATGTDYVVSETAIVGKKTNLMQIDNYVSHFNKWFTPQEKLQAKSDAFRKLWEGGSIVKRIDFGKAPVGKEEKAKYDKDVAEQVAFYESMGMRSANVTDGIYVFAMDKYDLIYEKAIPGDKLEKADNGKPYDSYKKGSDGKIQYYVKNGFRVDENGNRIKADATNIDSKIEYATINMLSSDIDAMASSYSQEQQNLDYNVYFKPETNVVSNFNSVVEMDAMNYWTAIAFSGRTTNGIQLLGRGSPVSGYDYTISNFNTGMSTAVIDPDLGTHMLGRKMSSVKGMWVYSPMQQSYAPVKSNSFYKNAVYVGVTGDGYELPRVMYNNEALNFVTQEFYMYNRLTFGADNKDGFEIASGPSSAPAKFNNVYEYIFSSGKVDTAGIEKWKTDYNRRKELFYTPEGYEKMRQTIAGLHSAGKIDDVNYKKLNWLFSEGAYWTGSLPNISGTLALSDVQMDEFISSFKIEALKAGFTSDEVSSLSKMAIITLSAIEQSEKDKNGVYNYPMSMLDGSITGGWTGYLGAQDPLSNVTDNDWYRKAYGTTEQTLASLNKNTIKPYTGVYGMIDLTPPSEYSSNEENAAFIVQQMKDMEIPITGPNKNKVNTIKFSDLYKDYKDIIDSGLAGIKEGNDIVEVWQDIIKKIGEKTGGPKLENIFMSYEAALNNGNLMNSVSEETKKKKLYTLVFRAYVDQDLNTDIGLGKPKDTYGWSTDKTNDGQNVDYNYLLGVKGIDKVVKK
jgi:hypothetical protein